MITIPNLLSLILRLLRLNFAKRITFSQQGGRLVDKIGVLLKSHI